MKPQASVIASGKAICFFINQGISKNIGSVGMTIQKMLVESFTNPLETQMEIEARMISDMARSPDGREGVDAFVAKRTPSFTGG